MFARADVRFILVAASIASTLGVGCVTRSDLIRRASFDLNCPEERIATTDLGNDTIGVDACGQQVTYVLACEQREWGQCRTGRWVMNNARGGGGQIQAPNGGMYAPPQAAPAYGPAYGSGGPAYAPPPPGYAPAVYAPGNGPPQGYPQPAPPRPAYVAPPPVVPTPVAPRPVAAQPVAPQPIAPAAAGTSAPAPPSPRGQMARRLGDPRPR